MRRLPLHAIARHGSGSERQRPVKQNGPTNNQISKAILAFLVACCVGAFAYVLLYDPSPTQQTQQVFAAGLLLPCLVLAAAFRTTGSLRYIVLAGLLLLNYLYFCVPFLAPETLLSPVFMGARFEVNDGIFILGYTAIFLFASALGFLIASRFRWRLLKSHEEGALSLWVMQMPAAPLLGGMLLSLVAANYYLDFLVGGGSFIGNLIRLAFPVLYFLFLLGDRPLLVRAAAAAMYAVFYPISISAGLLAPWMFANALIVGGLVVVRRKISWVLLAVAIAGTVPIAATKGEFREWRRESAQSTRLEGGIKFLELSWGRSGKSTNNVESDETISRFSMGPIVFSRVLQAHELRAAEFQFGSTFADLPLVLLPRALFPWKPEKTTGQWFGHTYGFLAPDNFQTSVNLPPIVEAYVNFGEWGAPVVGLMVGVIWGGMFSILGGGRSVAGGLFIGLVFSSFANAESPISIVYGQALQVVLLLWLSLLVYRSIGRSGDRGRRASEGAQKRHSSESRRK